MSYAQELFWDYHHRLLTDKAKSWATVCWHGGTMRSLHMVKPFDISIARAIAASIADIKSFENK